MIYILVIERNARERKALLVYLQDSLDPERCIGLLKSRVDITALDSENWSGEELKSSGTNQPSIVVIGQDSAEKNPDIIARARNTFANATIMVMVAESSLTALQHYTLYGAHNVIGINSPASILFGAILSSLSRNQEIKRGKLILIDSGKGGVGVTTFAAAFGASLSLHKVRTTLLDLDYESQDLTRFFRVRPFVNEMLEGLLQQVGFISVEQVLQCCLKVWEGDDLDIVPPAPGYEGLLKGNVTTWKQFRLLLEVVDSQRDVVIIDVAGMPSSVASRLYEVADVICYIVSLDPTSVHASLSRLKNIMNSCSLDDRLYLVPIEVYGGGIATKELINEFSSHVTLAGAKWLHNEVPVNKQVRYWAGSGNSPIELGNRKYKNTFTQLGYQLGLHKSKEEEHPWTIATMFERVREISVRKLNREDIPRKQLHLEVEGKQLVQLPSDTSVKADALITKATVVGAR
jgi:MinD-like ATPase involved in chromosome partitioning or flagellar assembly